MTTRAQGAAGLIVPDGVHVVPLGELPAGARLGVVASAYHGEIISTLLAGVVLEAGRQGIPAERVDVVEAPGAYELGLAARALAASGRYVAVVALGCVIRGGTPHFEYVAGEAAAQLSRAALDTGVPVAFGVLTVNTLEQALARAGGSEGNKGEEFAAAALALARALVAIDAG